MFSGGFPGGFFGMGGGAGMQQESDGQQAQVDNTSYYKELNVDQKASIDQIKKAFRKLAMKCHPDKPGGDAQKFKKIKQAYDVLGNPEKKDLYDKFGKQGVQAGGNPRGGRNLFDLFNGGGQKSKGPQKGKPKLIKVQVTLQQVYQGCTKKVSHKRMKLCETCQGKGGKGRKDCTKCKGAKYVQRVVQMGPGMITSTRGPCPQCKGQGFMIQKKDICKSCNGKMIIEQQKTLDVGIEQGCPNQKDYIFTGQSDQLPGMLASDLYVRVFIKKHQNIERKGADLFMKKKISLVQALTGVHFQFKHLDGKKIQVSSFQGQTIAPNSLKVIKRLGMPFYNNVMANGNFYIKFQVEFPKKINKLQRQQFKQILPGPDSNVQFDIKQDDVHMLQQFDQRELNTHVEGGRGGNQQEDDEQDIPHGAQKVQCAIQ